MHRRFRSFFKTIHRRKIKSRLQKRLLTQRRSRRIPIKRIIGGAEAAEKVIDEIHEEVDEVINNALNVSKVADMHIANLNKSENVSKAAAAKIIKADGEKVVNSVAALKTKMSTEIKHADKMASELTRGSIENISSAYEKLCGELMETVDNNITSLTNMCAALRARKGMENILSEVERILAESISEKAILTKSTTAMRTKIGGAVSIHGGSENGENNKEENPDMVKVIEQFFFNTIVMFISGFILASCLSFIGAYLVHHVPIVAAVKIAKNAAFSTVRIDTKSILGPWLSWATIGSANFVIFGIYRKVLNPIKQTISNGIIKVAEISKLDVAYSYVKKEISQLM